MTGRRTVRLGALAVALLLASVAPTACGGEGGAGAGAGPSGPPRVGDTVPTTRTVDGVDAPWFAAATLEGDTVTIADLRGTPVLVNMWATWCPPCRNEMPYLQSVHERYDGALRTVGISVDNRGARDQVRDFLAEADVTYEILLDPSMRSLDLFDLPGLPGTFLLDADGLVTFARIGPVIEGEAAFEGALERLMGSSGGPGDEP